MLQVRVPLRSAIGKSRSEATPDPGEGVAEGLSTEGGDDGGDDESVGSCVEIG